MELGVLVAVGLVLAGGGLVCWFVRRGGRRRAVTEFYHFRCPRCKRRLRFQPRQVGHQGACSSCRQAVTFPPLSQAIE
jgi:hypothetical protein